MEDDVAFDRAIDSARATGKPCYVEDRDGIRRDETGRFPDLDRNGNALPVRTVYKRSFGFIHLSVEDAERVLAILDESEYGALTQRIREALDDAAGGTRVYGPDGRSRARYPSS